MAAGSLPFPLFTESGPHDLSKELLVVLDMLRQPFGQLLGRQGGEDDLRVYLPLHYRYALSLLRRGPGRVVIEGDAKVIWAVASDGAYGIDLLEIGALNSLDFNFHDWGHRPLD